MNRTKTPFVVLAATLALYCTGCGDSAEASAARQQIQEAIDATEDLVVSTLADLKQKAEPRLQQLDQRTAELRARIAEQGAAAAERAKTLLAQAEAELARARDKLASAADAGAGSADAAWDSMKQTIAHAGQALDEAWTELNK